MIKIIIEVILQTEIDRTINHTNINMQMIIDTQGQLVQ